MTEPAVRRALLQFPLEGSRRWLAFDSPRATIVADELRDVPGAMLEAERAAAAGRWAVGMVSYDAGPAFDDAIRSSRMRRVPLVSFGVFDAPRIVGPPTASGGYHVGPWLPNRSRPAYLTTVRTIRELIAAETSGNVLSDDRIAEVVNQSGVDIARRTVAKYSEAMGIPASTRRRREMGKVARGL